MNKYKCIGICDSFEYPCFARIIYKKNNKSFIQIKEGRNLRLKEINTDLSNEKTIGLGSNLDIIKENYCIVVNSKKVFYGTKKEISQSIDNKILNSFNIYFKIDYCAFIGDFLNLIKSCDELINNYSVSYTTKEWATELRAGAIKKVEVLIHRINALNRVCNYIYNEKTYTVSFLNRQKGSRTSLKHVEYSKLNKGNKKVNIIKKQVGSVSCSPKIAKYTTKPLLSKQIEKEIVKRTSPTSKTITRKIMMDLFAVQE